MQPLKVFAIVSWLSLPTVMFGGYSLLKLRGMQRLTEDQLAMFRAGHAHAGVLLVLSLVYYRYLEMTGLASHAIWVACSTLTVGILLQSGGFFWQAFVDKTGKKTGVHITAAGALLLAAAVLGLVYGLIAT